jgi:hypothetical protein
MAIVQMSGDSSYARQMQRHMDSLPMTWKNISVTSTYNGGIYDVVFALIPEVIDHPVFNPDVMLHSFIAISLVAGAFHYGRISGPTGIIRVLRRFLWLYGFGYLLRSMTLAFTTLPPSDVRCVPVERSLVDVLLTAPKLLFGHARNCTDKLFSGHTTVATLLFWFWQEARNEAHDRIFSPWRIYPLVHLLLMAISSILGRNHYTVDIVLSYVINTLTFWTFTLSLRLAEHDLEENGKIGKLLRWCDGYHLKAERQQLLTQSPIDAIML